VKAAAKTGPKILDSTLNSLPRRSPHLRAKTGQLTHLEALYAQFTPTPEELERRKRENEALRSGYATDPSDPQPPVLRSPAQRGEAGPALRRPCEGGSTQPTHNPQQYYGPCPSPLGWHGHRYLDTSKVQTS